MNMHTEVQCVCGCISDPPALIFHKKLQHVDWMKLINFPDIYYAIRSEFNMLKVVYSSSQFGYSQQTTMPLDRRNTSSIFFFRCSVCSVILPHICGREIKSATFFWSAIPLLFFFWSPNTLHVKSTWIWKKIKIINGDFD